LELTLFEQNYHIQLRPPYNAIILGGARAVLVHKPDECFNRDNDDLQFEGVPEFMRSWPESDVAGWDESQPAELARDANDGGCWTGSEFSSGGKSTLRSSYHTDCCIVTASSVDMFPFVGPVPNREGNWMAAGFVGHGKLASFIYWHRRLTNVGMPRILLSTAHIIPGVLDSLGFEYKQPALVAPYPPLPKPFHVTAERVERLQSIDLAAKAQAYRESCKESSQKPFCVDERSMPRAGSSIAVEA
jgi:hypothetical protein